MREPGHKIGKKVETPTSFAFYASKSINRRIQESIGTKKHFIMKNLSGILCVTCGIFILSACTEEFEEDFQAASNSNEAGMTEVSLNLGGDFIDVYDSPLTRSAQRKKLYAVNVYYSQTADSVKLGENKDFTFPPEYSYRPYAYGVFDKPETMKIKLSDKFVYKFECTVVREDLEELQTYWTSKYKIGEYYSYPFVKIDAIIGTKDKADDNDLASKELIGRTKTLNTFSYSTENNLSEIKNGKAYVKTIENWSYVKNYYKKKNLYSSWLKNETFPGTFTSPDTLFYCNKSYPAIDRWYGELEGFITKSGNATIDLTRTAFGLKMIVTPPTDGTITVESGGNFCIDIKAPSYGSQNPFTQETLFCYDKVYDLWYYAHHDYVWYWNNIGLKDALKTNNKLKEGSNDWKKAYDSAKKKWQTDSTKMVNRDFSFSFVRERADGSKQTLATAVPVTRNKLTTVIFDAEKMADTSFTINENENIEADTTIVVK